MALGFFTSDPNDPSNAPDSFESIQRKRQLAQALMTQGMDTSPVKSWTQGAARLAQSLAGNIQNSRLDDEEKGNNAYARDMIAKLLGGDSSASSAAPAAPGVAGAAPTASSQPNPSSLPSIAAGGDKSAFVASLMPKALEASKTTGVDPRLIVAQAALESGYGQHAPGNNLFGIKGSGPAGSNNLATTEVVNGQSVPQQANFRAYASPADSVDGYASFIMNNPRYAPMRNAQGLDNQIAALGSSGYATDPNYAAKIASIVKGLSVPQNGFQAINQAAPQAPSGAGQPAMAFSGSPEAPTPAPAQPPQQVAQAAPQAPPAAAAASPAAGGQSRAAAIAAMLTDPRISPQMRRPSRRLCRTCCKAITSPITI
jgi:flagellum-specific peptidoglycan hydrolase FlgJ